MALHARKFRDSLALAFAAVVTLAVSLAPEPTPKVSPGRLALEGLLDAQTAQSAGAWWLDEPTATARLSVAPEHGLVWRVGTDEQEVLLDATTGEPLAFEFQ